MSTKRTVFVDSDAFVATLKEVDTTHKKALFLLDNLLQQSAILVTSNYVFSETITVLSQRMGHEAAVAYTKQMQSPSSFFLKEWVDESLEEAAIEIFKHQTSKNTSFVDCTNMVFMKRLNIDAIFSFDEVYRKNGFKLVEDIV